MAEMGWASILNHSFKNNYRVLNLGKIYLKFYLKAKTALILQDVVCKNSRFIRNYFI